VKSAVVAQGCDESLCVRGLPHAIFCICGREREKGERIEREKREKREAGDAKFNA